MKEEKFFTDEELGTSKYMKEKRDPSIIPPAVETKCMPQSRMTNQTVSKERMHATKPWKPKGRK